MFFSDHYLAVDKEEHGYLTIYYRKIKNPHDLVEETREILKEQKNSFTINCQLGYLLREVSTGQIQPWYAAENSSLWDKAIRIKRHNGFQKVLDKMKDYPWEDFFTTPTSGKLKTILYFIY